MSDLSDFMGYAKPLEDARIENLAASIATAKVLSCLKFTALKARFSPGYWLLFTVQARHYGTLNHLISLLFNSLKLIKYFISECIFVPKIRDLN